MSENKPVISAENMPTAVATVFVLALLTLAFSLYNYKQVHELAQFYGKVAVISAKKTGQINDSVSKISDLEQRIAALEAARAEAPTAPAPEAPVPVPVAAPK